MRPPKPAGPAPDAASLRQAALTYLTRYSATQTGLLRVLGRRIDRWARVAEAPPEAAAAAKAAARGVVAHLASIGAVDDALFAAGRARSLHRAGRSRRAIAAHLQAKGVPPDLASPPDDPAAELAAAVLYASRRRMGPFRPSPSEPVSGEAADPARRMRELGRLARAGFPATIAGRVLDLPPEEAEALLLEARRG